MNNVTNYAIVQKKFCKFKIRKNKIKNPKIDTALVTSQMPCAFIKIKIVDQKQLIIWTIETN